MDIIAELKISNARIRYLDSELKNAEAKMALANIEYSGVSRSTYKGSALEETTVNILDMYDQLKRLIFIECKLREKMWIMMDAIPCSEAIDVVNYIVLNNMSYSEIAEAMKYSARQVRRFVDKTKEYFNTVCENQIYLLAVEKALSENKPLIVILKTECPEMYEYTLGHFSRLT